MARPDEPALGQLVLYLSDDVAVVNKPPAISTEPARSGEPSLRDKVTALLSRGARAPHAVSRLDTNVTGAVVFALTERGARALAEAKQGGRYRRVYVALASGKLISAGRWTADVGGQDAETAVWPIAQAGPDKRPTSLLALMPQTGRTHQIRIHASGAGAPLAGDKRYGGPSTVPTKRGAMLGVSRPMLHAAAVDFPDPARGAVVVRAPIPADMTDLWSALDGRPEAWEEALVACGVASSSPPP
ncbi:MAG: RluA family pseudouridine synthase [Myxococcales bacterium]|nr:RluA family pseudouridine synthase [Myxococcales bacterium]